jgi:hypothetical protein
MRSPAPLKVKEQAQHSPQTVKGTAGDAKDTVKEQATSGGGSSSDTTGTYGDAPAIVGTIPGYEAPATGFELPATGTVGTGTGEVEPTEDDRRLGDLRGPGLGGI